MLNILIIGGSGEISTACVAELQRLGHCVTVFNRGQRAHRRPQVEHLAGDVNDPISYERLGSRSWDVVCQFLGFVPADVERDIRLFAGRCQQYVFISSASCYQKPWRGGVVTEHTPLHNPFLEYSRNKARCEQVLQVAHDQGLLPVTIVRPSHTYHRRLPSVVIDGDHLLWRVLRSKPVPLHDNGELLWTLTHAEDFAEAFAKLCGNPQAAGEAYHITDSTPVTWNALYQQIGTLTSATVAVCYISSQELVAHELSWRGPLLGDKANSMVFDNTKVANAVGGWACKHSLVEGLTKVLSVALPRQEQGYQPNAELEASLDRLIAQSGG